MTVYPAWTPASRPGIIPLHPLGFGTILGRSFVALRHNPRVLLGFALGVQALAYLIVLAAVAAVGWSAFSRLDTVRPGTDDFDAVMAGSIAVTAITGFVLGLAAGALGVLVQGVVVSEVAHAAVAEKLSLRAVWQRVKPVAWRLIGYSLLLTLGVLLLLAAVAAALFAIGAAALPVAVGLTVIVVLAAVPLTLWLSTKLLLVPAVIILEHATILGAIARSWRLIRGRFWPALGVIVVVGLLFGAIGQVIGIPFSFLSTGLVSVISPTGDPEPSAVIALIVTAVLTQVVTLAVQAVAVVVQSTATALIYIDCRMRREGLDLDLLAYVERRDAGATSLPDPFRAHIGRELGQRPGGPVQPPAGMPYPMPAYGTSPYGAPPAYGTGSPVPPAYGAPGYPAPAYGTGSPVPPAYGAPGYPAPASYPPPPAYAPAAPDAAPPAQPVADPRTASGETDWTAPGTPDDGNDRESPWR